MLVIQGRGHAVESCPAAPGMLHQMHARAHLSSPMRANTPSMVCLKAEHCGSAPQLGLLPVLFCTRHMRSPSSCTCESEGFFLVLLP